MALLGQEHVKVVFGLKGPAPFNLNLSLRAHAQQHGLVVHNLGYHPHHLGNKVSLDVSGKFDNTKKFIESAKSHFGAYISNATVQAAKQPIFGR